MTEDKGKVSTCEDMPRRYQCQRSRRWAPAPVKVAMAIVVVIVGAAIMRCFRHHGLTVYANVIPGYYSEGDVAKFLTTGMPYAAVVAKYGRPRQTIDSGNGCLMHFWNVADYPHDRIYEFAFSGFTVSEKEGIVVSFGFSHVSTER